MCFNETTWRWVNYRKHKVPPSLRGAAKSEIDRNTANGRDSLYYMEVDQRAIETAVAQRGNYVESAKVATVLKVMEFPNFVGASEGQPSRWVQVEHTSGEFHGRPIAENAFNRKMKRPTTCC